MRYKETSVTKKRIAGFGKIFVFIGLSSFLLLLMSSGFSRADEDSWTADSSINIAIDRDAKIGLNKANTDCYNQQLTTLTKAGVNEPLEPEHIEQCVLSTPAGIFGGGYVKPNTFYTYKIFGNKTTLVGIPNSTKYLQLYRDSDYSTVSLLDDLSAHGNFTVENSNKYRGSVYKPNIETSPFIKDVNGAWLRINKYAFSGNGQWMVAEAPRYGFVRINVSTGQAVLFTDLTFNYRFNFVEPALAISNNGQYVAISGFGTNMAKVYDISRCVPQDGFNLSKIDTSGCESKDLSADLRAADNNFLHLSGLRFSGNDRTIEGTIATSHTGPGYDTAKITLSLDAINEKPVSYLAMGDSFASGEGDMDDSWYEEGTNVQDVNLCHLSKRSYPYLLASDLDISDFHSIACSGAKQEYILNIGQYPAPIENSPLGKFLPGFKKQKDYINDGSSVLSFLTISIGGNDMGFGHILLECLLPGTCQYANNQSMRNLLAMKIALQYDNLKNTYRQLIQATGGKTKIYIIGYPEFVQGYEGTCGTNVLLNDDEREFVSQTTRYANQVIKAAAESEGVYYVDVQNALEGRNLCSGISDSLMAVNGVTSGDDKLTAWYSGFTGGISRVVSSSKLGIGNETYHPNQIGHILLHDKVLERLGDPKDFAVCPDADIAICPSPEIGIPSTDPNYFGNLGDIYDPNTWKPIDYGGELFGLGPYSVQLRLGGLLADSGFRVELHSNPVNLGQFQTDGNGNSTFSVDIPENTAPGYHELHIYAYNSVGEKIDYFKPIYVLGPDGDINSNGVPDGQEKCGFVGDSGIDYDQDGIDDACDRYIGAGAEQAANDTSKNNFEQVIGNPPEDTSSADIIGGVNPTNNSSDFLFQSGGSLQAQGSVPQGSISGLQNNGGGLFSDTVGTGQQDILGQATVVGPVQFDASKIQPTQQNQVQNSNGIDWGVALVFAGLAVALVLFALAVRKIIRTA